MPLLQSRLDARQGGESSMETNNDRINASTAYSPSPRRVEPDVQALFDSVKVNIWLLR